MIFGANWSFVQNPKAASSAVTTALLPFCEPVPPAALPCGKPSKHFIPRAGCVPLMQHRIGVVRNPYDRVVSAWTYLVERGKTTATFREFVLHGEWKIGQKPALVDFMQTPQSEWLVGCNKVFRFETLNVDFPRWAEQVLGRRVRLEHTNPSKRSGGFAAYYTDDDGRLDQELIEAVRVRFWFDFEVWGYGFSGA